MKSVATNFLTFELLDEPKGFGSQHADIELELAAENTQDLKNLVWERAKKAGLLNRRYTTR